MKKQFYLTQEGIDELKTELEALISQRGPIAERIKTAREFGDLSENAEYSTARQEQERVEGRIAEIEHILQNVDVIRNSNHSKKVQLGASVTLKAAGKVKQFQVVGTVEADPLSGKISDESPIGKVLLGKQEGDKVEIANGGGEIVSYKIAAIS